MEKTLRDVLLVSLASGTVLNLLDVYGSPSPIYHLTLFLLYFLPFLGFLIQDYKKNLKYFVLGGVLVSLFNDLLYPFFVVGLGKSINFPRFYITSFNILNSTPIWPATWGPFSFQMTGMIMGTYTLARVLIAFLILFRLKRESNLRTEAVR